jgi:hypothetical protein
MSNYITSVEAWNIRDRSGTVAQRAEDPTWRSNLDAEAKKADLSDCIRRHRCRSSGRTRQGSGANASASMSKGV